MEKDSNKTNGQNERYLRLFGCICLGIVLITVLYFLVVNALHDDDSSRGTFGDLFGGLTATFTGFAFAGVIITIIMQMKELELTREELKKSVDAQDKTQKALNMQLKHMQSTTRIESVKDVISIYSQRDEQDKKEIAKAILERLTEEIFYDSEFVDLVTPKVEIRNRLQLRGKRITGRQEIRYEDYDEEKKNHVTLEFRNTGPAFRMSAEVTSITSNPLTIKYSGVVETWPSGGGVHTSYPALNEGNLVERDSIFRMTIGGITNEREIEVNMNYEGAFIKHSFSQRLLLNRNGSTISSSLGLVSLVKSAAQ